MAFTPILAHGADPRTVFGSLMFIALIVTGMSLSSSKKPDEKKTGCIMLVIAGVVFIGWFIYGYWQANRKLH